VELQKARAARRFDVGLSSATRNLASTQSIAPGD
jgi:hypothetical protein